MRKFVPIDKLRFTSVYRIVQRRDGEVTARYNARLVSGVEREDDDTFTLRFQETSEPANSGTLYINE
ncbi:hypothetical protein BW13_00835 [Bifidobacterium sp. UTCIF-37]|uniref:hypothetical protein n=1 Tax=unclassified Bifidobacterium TaxID=2608897 RepID=UPI00112E6FE8|nr:MULTISPECIES: hypothetical protein [unclassified Bifidobacterium]TPF87429.1 hypothetical protein BW13_00835 [Bifidobacterium sp. UTCIF-37]TPF91205.1 hypothetical protein BW11_00835 [Bifidobacterium sp. UTCIF-38]